MVQFISTPERLLLFYMKKSEIANPGGCRYCGQPRYFHCQLWHGPERGIEGFIEPTQEQIKERMLTRRGLRQVPVFVDNYPIHSEERNFPDNGLMPNAD
jgi:hypothetical protein